MSPLQEQATRTPIRRSYIVAGVIFLVLVAYVGSGAFGSTPKPKPADDGKQPAATATAAGATPAAAAAKDGDVPTVRVRTIHSEVRKQDHVLRGQTEALRKVVVKAETAGKVAAIHADRGARVKAGDTICELNVDERMAMLKQARAVMKQRQLEYDASRQLKEKGFRSETALAGDQAQFEAAKA